MVKKVPSIRQEKRPSLVCLSVPCIECGYLDGRPSARWNSKQTAFSRQSWRKQNYIVLVPRSARAARLALTQRLRLSARDGDALESAVREERDPLAVWRPEWRTCVFGSGEHLRG